MKDGVSKMVGDKVVCERWCVKDGVCVCDKGVCGNMVCERWYVCDKDGVCVCERGCVKDGV